MKRSYKIAVIPGDGTGPEVVQEGLKVLKAVAQAEGFKTELTEYDLGGERYLKTSETLPDAVLAELRKMDTIFLGAIGHPKVKPGILEKGILLRIRFELDLYINLRPVKLYPGVATPLKDKGPKEIDFVIVRENTEGLYAGAGGFLKKLTLCGKTNVLTYAFDLWERAFQEVAKEYPDITTDYAHVDAICMWMVKNPEWFDVIVTDNLFGDIITDLGAMIQGGMGIAAGGNINPQGVSMFEPIGGSAPKYTGKNVINPLAAISACQMMLDQLGEEKAARRIEKAVMQVVKERLKGLSAGEMGYTTAEVGDLVADSCVKA